MTLLIKLNLSPSEENAHLLLLECRRLREVSMKGNVLKPSVMYTENGVYLQTEYKPKTDKPKTDKPRTDRPKTEQTDTMTKIITKARFSNKHRISNTNTSMITPIDSFV